MFSSLGLQPAALLQAVEDWADQRLAQLNPEALSMSMWTFARMGPWCSPRLLQTAAQSALRQLDTFTHLQLSRVGQAAPQAARVLSCMHTV